MNFYPTERIALFIDGANLYATAKSLAFDIDYNGCSRCSVAKANSSEPSTIRHSPRSRSTPRSGR